MRHVGGWLPSDVEQHGLLWRSTPPLVMKFVYVIPYFERGTLVPNSLIYNGVIITDMYIVISKDLDLEERLFTPFV